MAVKQILKFKIDSAHYLPGYEGPCKNLHGHTWGVIIELEGEVKDNGMVADFKKEKEWIKEYLDRLDHFELNRVLKNPTAELLAGLIFNDLNLREKSFIADLVAVEVWESDDCGVRYEG